MAYDEHLAERLRLLFHNDSRVTEKPMFGGLCVLLNGNMVAGIVKNELMLRLGPVEGPAALSEPHTREMDFAGKPMTTMIYVGPAGFASDAQLKQWVGRAVAFTEKLPPKEAKPKKPRKPRKPKA